MHRSSQKTSMAFVLQAFFVWIERSRGTGPRATVKPILRRARSPDLDMFAIGRSQTTESGTFSQILLQNGPWNRWPARFSIDMQVLADLKRVPVCDQAIANYRILIFSCALAPLCRSRSPDLDLFAIGRSQTTESGDRPPRYGRTAAIARRTVGRGPVPRHA